MNEIDMKILNILQADARNTISQISSMINLSVSATAERIKKLERSGIITKYTTILNPEMLQRELSAFMLVSIKNNQSDSKFLEYVEKEKDILECNCITGDYDYIVKIITHNTKTLESLLNTMKSIEGIKDTNTIIVLANKKQNFSISV